MAFSTPIDRDGATRTGPARRPAQMLADQTYDGGASVHDAETAAALGLAGAPIEGPTHFSQFDPLAYDLWGRRWFETGCISSHFRTMVIEGEEVIASLTDRGDGRAEIAAVKADGTPVLKGTATVDPDAPTALRERVAEVGRKDPGRLHIIDQLTVGDILVDDAPHVVDMATPNGNLYPFSLKEKLDRITEPSSWYDSSDNPWGRPIIPFEMYSVLTNKQGRSFQVRGPSKGLFVDLEVRAVAGPLFVDQPYLIEREIVAVGQSRRVEAYWTESRILDADTKQHVATVLLHQGVFKASYAGYPTGAG
ncbi:MAG: hypothetical protein ACK5RL_10095 [Acidimicrobiales bacterium]